MKGYIFDYGGTLDTGGHHWGKVIWHAYQRQQVPVTEAQFREAYVYAERTLGRNPIIQPDFTFHKTLETKLRLQLQYLQENSLRSALPHRSAKNSPLGAKRRFACEELSTLTSPLSTLHSQLYAHTRQVTAHSREVLLQLHEQYPMVLVSNFYGNIAVVLREFGFEGLFQQIIESAVVGIRKPDPRIFTLGVEALGLQPEEVVVVGDSMDKDIIPAKKAGCHTVWFKGEGWTDDPVDESIPDKIITDLNELI
ncbi:MAG: HAD family hydrolase [Prevotella sp.]|nr:HAD family hydrolase [Prevotella sp.]